MLRCLELAQNGRATVAPNPMVGCVIVHEDTIIGEGWHPYHGGPHAEVQAIASIADPSKLKEATLYVNLEPCAHHGKTPPCADLIVSKQVKKVVIACKDPFHKVAGKGIGRLKEAGCEVRTGLLEKEGRELNKRFFTWHEQKRPYVILKWAETRDGFIDRDRNEHTAAGPNWITGSSARQLVHKWRTEEMAIMIGSRTALHDNPALTVRDWVGKNPLRIVINRAHDLPEDLQVFDGSTPTLLFTDSEHPEQKEKENLTFVGIQKNRTLFPQVLEALYHRNIQSVLVEGGAGLLQHIINSDLWDEARQLIGENIFFEKGLKAPTISKTHITGETTIDQDRIIYYTNKDALPFT